MWLVSKKDPAPAQLDDDEPSPRIQVEAPARTSQAISPTEGSARSIGREAAFFGRGTAIRVGSFELRDPLAYVAASPRNADASTIITELRIGNARHATQLGYWPSYADSSADQRAAYLEWMAGGRQDATVQLGLPFIFFYGLERRVFVDRQDVEACRAEVTRLLDMFGQSNSFWGYATRFLSFLPLADWQTLNEGQVIFNFQSLSSRDELALSAALAWYYERKLPLPPQFAASAATAMEGAKRGVVLERARDELVELFRIRYLDRFGSGLVVAAGKNPKVLEYHPASGTLLRQAGKPRAIIPDVLARQAQFKPLVEIWNSCVDDLRKLSSKKAGAPDQVTREMWEAMPEELRAQVDHPDLDRWLDFVNHAPRVGSAHLVNAGDLARLVGMEASDRVTAAQGRKITQSAALLGFAIEPDLRVAPRSMPSEAPIAIWRAHDTSAPDAAIYVPATTLLSLLLSIVIADEEADDRELGMVTTLIEDSFVVDDMMRQRLSALREILVRVPAKSNAIAKRLRETKTSDQLKAVGKMLAAVAAADGILADGEHKALKSVFKALGLGNADLDSALVTVGLRLKAHEPISIAPATRGKGEAIPKPPAESESDKLDQEAIARILAETREVASILADVLDTDDSEEASAPNKPAPSVTKQVPSLEDKANGPFGSIASSLDLKFHPALAELLTRPVWSEQDARNLARKHRLLPGGLVEAINAWTEDELGDSLILEGPDWRLNADVAQRLSS